MSSGIAFLDFEIMEILLSAVLVAMFTMPQSAVCSLVPADFKSAGTEMEMDRFIDSLMAEMTVEEKAGQLTLVTYDRSFMTGETQSRGVAKKIAEGKIGGVFNVRTLEDKINIQKLAVEQTRLGILAESRFRCALLRRIQQQHGRQRLGETFHPAGRPDQHDESGILNA